MVLFPNCKINLGLNITGKRTDGYHNIETVFYPLALKDILEVVTANQLHFQSTGILIHGPANDNLCVKAWQILKNDFPDLPFVQIHLHKCIPIGAGLGGGSADGAFMLLLLNKKYNLQLTTDQLIQYALQLGSDCPFFIINEPVFASGRGEIMQPVKVDLKKYVFHIVNPGIHISTKTAFDQLLPAIPQKSIVEIIQQPVETWQNELNNDFEKTIFRLYPEIQSIKEQLYAEGAIFASMTGTGSTVYGLFDKNKKPSLNFPTHYLHVEIPAQ